jgi:hypothetical protein
MLAAEKYFHFTEFKPEKQGEFNMKQELLVAKKLRK